MPTTSLCSMSSWGIIYPPVIDKELWNDDAESLVGQILDDSRLTYNFVDDDYVYITPVGVVADENTAHYMDNILLPKECIVEVLECKCSTKSLMTWGCGCGAIKSEKRFKQLLEDSKKKLKRK